MFDHPKEFTAMAHRRIGAIMMGDEKLMEVLKNYHVVKLDDQEFNEKLTWCLEHCQHKFRDISDQNGRLWYFQNEKDATMFAMKWS
jgi:hypothetical protein